MNEQASVEDRIIAAALGLIAEDGLGAVTMLRIAESAGVARQTLYNRYPDVDSIVVAAISRHNSESIRMLELSLSVVDGPEGKLGQLVRHVVAVGTHASHAAGIQHGLSADARAALSEYDHSLDLCIREILEEGRNSGAFRRSLEPNIDTVLIRYLLNGLSAQAGSAPSDAASLAATGERTLLAAVRHR